MQGACVLGLALGAATSIARAEPTTEFSVTIKDHRFDPAELRVPAGQRLTIHVTNSDPTAEEFESNSMKVEKVIAGGTKGVVRINPLKPGRYEFYGEYFQATAQGVMIAE